MIFKCKNCGKIFKDFKSRKRIYCSIKCKPAPKGEKAYRWKGGKTRDSHGYIVLSNFGKRIFEHRYIMEKHLGRKLGRHEDVHHKNGIKDDNRLENLEVLAKSVHSTLSLTGRKVSEETKRRISKSNKGSKRSVEARERMRMAQYQYLESKPTLNKTCKYCKKDYQTKNSRKIFCSKNCSKKFHKK